MTRLGLALVLVLSLSVVWLVAPTADAQATFTVVASGLTTPRGMTFGPDGKLYVAEAGNGGDEQTDWVPPFRTAKFGNTGRITRIEGSEKTVIASGFQSVAEGPGAETVGVDDLAFLGDTLYAVVGQAN